MNPKTALRNFLLLALLVLLQGCGFHLRGSSVSANLPAAISPIHIQGLPSSDVFRQELESQLLNSDAQVTNDAAQAASLMRITNKRSKRRVLTVNSSGKVLEYELKESLSFSLSDRAGNERIPVQSVQLIQIYTNSEDDVLGGEHEEDSLREEMWRRLADQVLRRLSAQLQ